MKTRKRTMSGPVKTEEDRTIDSNKKKFPFWRELLSFVRLIVSVKDSCIFRILVKDKSFVGSGKRF